jgi:periplasmic protein TonB
MNTMNNNKDDEGVVAAEMEARIMAWVSGEASPAEAAELEGLAGARPEIAALKQRVETLLRLASEATASDREPLRFSAERRWALLQEFDAADAARTRGAAQASEAPTIPQIPILMRRANLAFAAVFSIALIAGVTWWGEQSHYKAALRTPAVTPATELFTVKPEDPVPVEVDDAPPKAKTNDVSPPSLPEVPAKPSIDSITQPIEPPHAVVDLTMTKISTDTDSGRAGDKLYKLSDLDQAPEATFQARPTYPFELRRAGTTGEVTVDFIVDANGNVRNVYAAHSSRQEFEQAACTAVSHWKFRPGRKGGRAVNVHMQVPILFTLSADGGP